jgi:hypothetical protein
MTVYTAGERLVLEDELLNYYRCPRHLLAEAMMYLEEQPNMDRAELVEALVLADQA